MKQPVEGQRIYCDNCATIQRLLLDELEEGTDLQCSVCFFVIATLYPPEADRLIGETE